jgi:hypothetical protein
LGLGTRLPSAWLVRMVRPEVVCGYG